MMEQLRERSFVPGSLEADASELLRATTPYGVPSGLKRRVRVRLLEGRPKRWLSVLLRPALIAACSLLAVGALAAVGGAALVHGRQAVPAVRAQATPVTRGAPQDDPSPPPVASVLPAPALSDTSQHEQGAAPAPVDPRRSATERAEHAEHAEHAAEQNAPSEAALVYGAAKALRNSGDAALAAKLLDDYSRRYPHGALAEEALALSIDVSIARGEGRANELATRYLARYPNGHFRAKAERVLAR